MTEPFTVDLGLVKASALSTAAYRGVGSRVFKTERDAIRDILVQELAHLWLKDCTVGDPNFQTILGYVERSPELFEAIVKFAKWNTL